MSVDNEMKIILASKSPRRYELMNLLNVLYQVIPSDEKEHHDFDGNLYDICINIAYYKALNVYNRTEKDRLVIGSDTIVKFNNEMLGKPKNRNDAYEMIKKISGNTHEVITSLVIIANKDNKYYEEKLYEVTKVTIDKLSDEEIYEWIDNHNVYDYAGGYAIQEEFGKYITDIKGDYFTVMGFPLNKVYNLLKKYINL